MEDQENLYRKHRFKIEFRYLFMIGVVVLIVFGGILLYLQHWRQTHVPEDRVVLRIFPQSDGQMQKLKKMKFISKDQRIDDFFEVNARFRDVLTLNNMGIPSAIVIEKRQHITIDPVYPDYQDIVAEIDSLADRYPEWIRVREIGRSQFYDKTILGVKISDFPEKEEDEPSILFMGGHHAREPLGILVCMEIVNYLMDHIEDQRTKHWLKQMEIWVVPCLNPDGYEYVLSNHLEYPWWRKNLRDNNGNGIFEPEIDGVDLNRNYDFNWRYGGSSEKSSWYYRGHSAASESEIQAIMNLASRERFVVAIDYHSFGEAILYPWGREMEPPDAALMKHLAQNMAGKLRKSGRKKPYDIIPLNGKSGQSSNWFYARWRTLSFILEVGPEYFPSKEMIQKILDEQIDGAVFLLDRMLTAAISGHIRDHDTHQPISAMIQFEEDFSPVVRPTISDAQYGRFWRLVLPGRYTITAMKEGYQSKELSPILVDDKRIRTIEIELEKMSGNE